MSNIITVKVGPLTVLGIFVSWWCVTHGLDMLMFMLLFPGAPC